jgi:hypothetical protein
MAAGHRDGHQSAVRSVPGHMTGFTGPGLPRAPGSVPARTMGRTADAMECTHRTLTPGRW